MAYTTIVGLKSAARIRPWGNSAVVLTKRSRTVGGPATRLCAETRRRALADVRDERVRLDSEPHPPADRPFDVDRAVVCRREGDFEVLGASADPADDLRVFRDPEHPDGRARSDYRGVDPAAGVGSPSHEILHLVAIEAADQEAQPETLVLQLIGNQQVAIAADAIKRGLDQMETFADDWSPEA